MMSYFAMLTGEDLSRYLNKIELVCFKNLCVSAWSAIWL